MNIIILSQPAQFPGKKLIAFVKRDRQAWIELNAATSSASQYAAYIKTARIRPTTLWDASGKDYARTEILWMNKQFVRAKKTGRVPVRLSRTEKIDNKINPPRAR